MCMLSQDQFIYWYIHTHTQHSYTPILDAWSQYSAEKGPDKTQEAGGGGVRRAAVWVTGDSPDKKYIDGEAEDTPRQEPSITVCIT